MLRFHLLALSHTKVSRDYSACAFTSKVRLLAKMLHNRGHHVTVYAPEGSQAECSEMVNVLDDATFQGVHGQRDWRRDGFLISRDTVTYRTFRDNAIREIGARAQPGDFLCVTFGWDHKEIADALAGRGLIVVETGIGYEATFAQHRVFESYAWMHITYGKEQRHNTPSFYDAVIPNGYDLADYPYPDGPRGATGPGCAIGLPGKEGPPGERPAPFALTGKYVVGGISSPSGPTGTTGPDAPLGSTGPAYPVPAYGDYFLYVARPNFDKGIGIARDIATATGIPLYTAGQGTPEQWGHSPYHLGVLSQSARNYWMARARAVLCPSLYVEPWLNVAVEAQLNGCPVITTDWGAVTENVLHGITGYRCHTMPEFIEAARNVHTLSRDACRRWAEQYSLEHIGARYEAYLERLAGLYGGEAGDFYGRRVGAADEVLV